jgi:hypothetical protein
MLAPYGSRSSASTADRVAKDWPMTPFYNTTFGNAIVLCKKNPQPFEPGASLRLKDGEGITQRRLERTSVLPFVGRQRLSCISGLPPSDRVLPCLERPRMG